MEGKRDRQNSIFTKGEDSQNKEYKQSSSVGIIFLKKGWNLEGHLFV
jgi:hypothetical protein